VRAYKNNILLTEAPKVERSSVILMPDSHRDGAAIRHLVVSVGPEVEGIEAGEIIHAGTNPMAAMIDGKPYGVLNADKVLLIEEAK